MNSENPGDRSAGPPGRFSVAGRIACVTGQVLYVDVGFTAK
jgi:hypothetical protein